jgi:cobalt/nickel transport system permease protein
MRLDAAILDIHRLDRLAAGDSPVHRVDPRAMVLVTAGFLVTVVSFPRQEIAELMPLALYPAALVAAGRVPVRVLARYLLLASPFAVMVGIMNPIVDREIAARIGPLALSGGWLSFLSILGRSLLTVSAALVLLACTGYVSVCAALGRLGAPRLLVTQFLLLYRFMFVLTEEAARMARAHALRSCSGRAAGIRVWSSLAGHLLLRTYDRGLRLHAAMLCRGFDGTLRPARTLRWSWTDTCFLAGWCGFFILVRFGGCAERLGGWVVEAFV